MSQAPPIRLSMLGALHASIIDVPGEPRAEALGPGKPLMLLVLLAVAPARSETRAELGALLWPGIPESQARQSLRQCLWQLRQRFGDEVLVTDGDTVSLAPHVTSDRDDFLAAVRAGRWRDAVAIHRGPFGAVGIRFSAGHALEEWISREAEFIRRRFLEAGSRVLPELEEAAEFDAARRLAERLRDAEPDNQARWRTVLVVGSHVWSPAELLTEAGRFERYLATEELTPEPASRDLLTRVARTAERSELVGRAEVMARLMAARHETERGAARWVHLIGVPGIGKSRILAELMALSDAAGSSVAMAKASLGARELEQSLLLTLVGALRRLRGATGASPSALAELETDALHVRSAESHGRDGTGGLVAALRDLLDAVASERHLIVVIDDLHWSDAGSLDVIRGLGAWLPDRVLLVTAARPQGLAAAGPEAALLELEPLTASEIERLVSSGAALPEAAWRSAFLEAIRRESGGNPLLVLETLRLVAAERLLMREGRQWMAPDPEALLRRLAEGAVIESRLAGLIPLDREVLGALATVGTGAAVDAIAAAVEAPSEQVRAALLRLESAGLVMVHERSWAPTHDLITETIVSTMPREMRGELHLRVGRFIAANAGGNLRALRAAAHHFVEADALAELQLVWRQWLAEARRAGDRSTSGELLADLVGDRLPPPWRRALLRGTSTRRAAVAAALLLVLAAVLIPLGMRPHRIAVVTAPFTGLGSLVPAPEVEVLDWFGRRVRPTAPVVARLTSRIVRLEGDSVVEAPDGRATFDEIRLAWEEARDSAVELRFFSGDLESPAMPIDIDAWYNDGMRLWLAGGSLNGQAVDSGKRVVRVTRGGAIRGQLRFRYRSRGVNPATLFAISPTWGDPRTVWTNLLALQTPVLNSRFAMDVDLTAPAAPGRYRLVCAFAYEGNGEALMSGSNWATQPIWGDGNDLAALADSAYDRADREGLIRVPWEFAAKRSPAAVAMTTLVIQVN